MHFFINYPFYKNRYFFNFHCYSSVLIPNLLELLFSDHWVRFYRIRKAPCQKTTFFKISFVKQYFWGFIAFLYTAISKELPKKIFWFFPNFDRNILKMIFGHMTCSGWYNLGLDGSNFLGAGSKWPQRHELKTNRELFWN